MAELQARSTRSSSSPTTCSRRRARRDHTAFFTMGEDRAGYVVEKGETVEIFTNPQAPADRGLRLRSVRLSEDDA